MQRKIDLNQDWLAVLADQFESDYMQQLATFLRAEKAQGKTLYPDGKNIFAALNTTPLDSVKVVILGQDPYHGPNQAHGLSFSVQPNIRIPPSLQNIFKEQRRDLEIATPNHGHLLSWAQQGVLLLNSVLTVEAGKAASHQGRGWEQFTSRVIEIVNDQTEHVVFMLWGAYAQKKGAVIDSQKHLVLQTTHPSPLSAHRGFLGCGHFSQANQYLRKHHRRPIDWQIPD
jgi:uracil-DNA glycosylase